MGELQDLTHFRKETEVMSRINFKQHELEEFRELFLKFSRGLNKLTYADILKFFAGHVVAGSAKHGLLKDTWKAVVKGAEEADFPDFLVLMQKLQEVDFISGNKPHSNRGKRSQSPAESIEHPPVLKTTNDSKSSRPVWKKQTTQQDLGTSKQRPVWKRQATQQEIGISSQLRRGTRRGSAVRFPNGAIGLASITH